MSAEEILVEYALFGPFLDSVGQYCYDGRNEQYDDEDKYQSEFGQIFTLIFSVTVILLVNSGFFDCVNRVVSIFRFHFLFK